MTMQNSRKNWLAGKRILIVGLGSAGLRHQKIARDMGAEVSVASRRPHVGEFNDIQEAILYQEWSLVILAHETAAHASDLKLLIDAGYKGKVLAEKPLFSQGDALANLDNLDLKVAYDFRMHAVVRFAKEWISRRDEKIVGASFYVGQHLWDWRPNRLVEDTYSARKDGGGGVLRDLSHELDLASWLLGPLLAVTANGGRVTNVTVDSDDFWNINAIHQNCENVTIHLNYLDRPAKRVVKLWTESSTLEVDVLSGKVQEGYDHITLPLSPELPFQDQMIAIFQEDSDLCNIEEGKAVMEYIRMIEIAAKEKRWVYV